MFAYWLEKRKTQLKPSLRRLQAPTPESDANPYLVFRQRAKPNKPLTRRRRETPEESLDKIAAIVENLQGALRLAELVRVREQHKTVLNVRAWRAPVSRPVFAPCGVSCHAHCAPSLVALCAGCMGRAGGSPAAALPGATRRREAVRSECGSAGRCRMQNNFTDKGQYQLLSATRERPQDELDKMLGQAIKAGFRTRVFTPAALPKPGERLQPSATKHARPGPPVSVRSSLPCVLRYQACECSSAPGSHQLARRVCRASARASRNGKRPRHAARRTSRRRRCRRCRSRRPRRGR